MTVVEHSRMLRRIPSVPSHSLERMRSKHRTRRLRGERVHQRSNEMTNIISICGSLRKGSFNRMLMTALPKLAPPGMSIGEAPSFADFPLYNADIQNSAGFPV